MSACPQCGVDLPDEDGPTHRYFGASPACWAAYGQVLEREYADPAFFKNHRMTVDAYALQHPGDRSPQAVQSVNIHLISTTLIFKYNAKSERELKAMQTISAASKKDKNLFEWLKPPASLGHVTVLELLPMTRLDDYLKAVEDWARSAWQAWESHHTIAETHLRRFGFI